MDLMETIQTILAICGGISVIGGAAAVIHKWIAPAFRMNSRVEALERHDKRDYEAIQRFNGLREPGPDNRKIRKAEK